MEFPFLIFNLDWIFTDMKTTLFILLFFYLVLVQSQVKDSSKESWFIKKFGIKASKPVVPLKENVSKFVEKIRENLSRKQDRCLDLIDDKRVEKCRNLLIKGANVQKCLCHQYDKVCEFQCQQKEKCFNFCKEKEVEIQVGDICVKKKVRVCQKRCIKNKKVCKRECKWRKLKQCYQDRLPGKYSEECSFIFNNSSYQKCMKNASDRCQLNCLQKCKHVRMPYYYKACFSKVIPGKTVKHCSQLKFKRECKQTCKNTKQCFQQCRNEKICYKDGDEKRKDDEEDDKEEAKKDLEDERDDDRRRRDDDDEETNALEYTGRDLEKEGRVLLEDGTCPKRRDCRTEQVCKTRCCQGQECEEKCQLKKVEECFLEIIPSKYAKVCQNMFAMKNYSSCVRKCYFPKEKKKFSLKIRKIIKRIRL